MITEVQILSLDSYKIWEWNLHNVMDRRNNEETRRGHALKFLSERGEKFRVCSSFLAFTPMAVKWPGTTVKPLVHTVSYWASR